MGFKRTTRQLQIAKPKMCYKQLKFVLHIANIHFVPCIPQWTDPENRDVIKMSLSSPRCQSEKMSMILIFSNVSLLQRHVDENSSKTSVLDLCQQSICSSRVCIAMREPVTMKTKILKVLAHVRLFLNYQAMHKIRT